MRSLPLAVTVGLVAAMTALPGSAQAAPPSNDTIPGAVALALNETVTQDTTEATTDQTDADLNTDSGCGAPFTNASVWYTYTPAADGAVLLDMTESDYSGGFLVFEGTPTADSLITCGPGLAGIEGTTGTTYTIMVISDTEVNGGNLVLTTSDAPPAPRLRVHLARRGHFDRGDARIHGTYKCKNAEFGGIFTQISQRVGRFKIPAFGDKGVNCDGAKHTWRMQLRSDTGRYGKGHAKVRTTLFGCGLFECDESRAVRRIRLVKGDFRRPSAAETATRAHTAAPKPKPLVSLTSRRWGQR